MIPDGSIVTVAMPAIQQDLGFTPAGLSWTVNAYLIAFGGLLLLAGRLGDLIGRKTMFVTGTIVFTAASVLAGVATPPCSSRPDSYRASAARSQPRRPPPRTL